MGQADVGIPFATSSLATDEQLRQRDRNIIAGTGRSRGLALKSLTLKHAHSGFFEQLFHHHNSKWIYFVSVAFDFSKKPQPVLWPTAGNDADKYAIQMREGETHEWGLGAGAPIYPKHAAEGGLAVAILVAQSEKEKREIAQVVYDISSKLASGGDVLAAVEALATNPAGITLAVALPAIGQVVKFVSGKLKDAGDDNLGAFIGLFPPEADWTAEMLSEEQPDVELVLAEVD